MAVWKMRTESPDHARWLRRFAWVTAGVTLLLIASGGLVTSKNVGMAVPDWPTTFGYNMFLFPISQWVGGIFYEHTHRLIASAVGLLTVILALWLQFSESRRWLKRLGWIAVAAVIFQGVLGGLRVTMIKDEIGIFHALLAQAFLCLLVFIALALSPVWQRLANERASAGALGPLTTLGTVVTVAIFLQLGLGATMRHQHRDLAILDFPTAYGSWIPDTSATTLTRVNEWREARALSTVEPSHIWLQMAHRFVAVAITVGVIWFFSRSRSGRQIPRLVRVLGGVWVLLLSAQLTLGAWTIWSNKAADVATAHVSVGAAMLALGVVLTAICRRATSAHLQTGAAVLARARMQEVSA